MIEKFKATSISIDEQEGQMILALFNAHDEYLFFQCPLESKDWDNGVYVEFKDQRHGAFDVLSVIDLSPQRLQLALKSPLFALPDVLGFEIALDCDADAVSALAEQLRAGFEGRSVQLNCQL